MTVVFMSSLEASPTLMVWFAEDMMLFVMNSDVMDLGKSINDRQLVIECLSQPYVLQG